MHVHDRGKNVTGHRGSKGVDAIHVHVDAIENFEKISNSTSFARFEIFRKSFMQNFGTPEISKSKSGLQDHQQPQNLHPYFSDR
jgi:hypothetical protein